MTDRHKAKIALGIVTGSLTRPLSYWRYFTDADCPVSTKGLPVAALTELNELALDWLADRIARIQ